MTDIDNNVKEDENKVEELLKGAGKRTPLPEDVRQRLENSFRAELAKSQRQTRIARFAAISGLAASLFVGFVLLTNSPTTADRETVAHVIYDNGQVNWSFEADAGPLRTGNTVAQGDVIRTSTGSVSIKPEGSMIDIRLAENTAITFEANDIVRLNHGSVYVDADPNSPHFPLTILANGLSIEHIGTQYLVSRQDMTIEIAVREGNVTIENGLDRIHSKGENGKAELLTFQSGKLDNKLPINTFDGRWTWTSGLAPSIETDGLQIVDFLAWVSRQSGYEIVYDNVSLDGKRIVGSYKTTDVFGALDQTMDISGLTATIDSKSGQITVSNRS